MHCRVSRAQGLQRAPSVCLPSHEAGHWVLGLQVTDPSAADTMVQGTLTICKDSTGLTNKPRGLHATQLGVLPTVPSPVGWLVLSQPSTWIGEGTQEPAEQLSLYHGRNRVTKKKTERVTKVMVDSGLCSGSPVSSWSISQVFVQGPSQRPLPTKALPTAV